jgi:hypothetical protein
MCSPTKYPNLSSFARISLEGGVSSKTIAIKAWYQIHSIFYHRKIHKASMPEARATALRLV